MIHHSIALLLATLTFAADITNNRAFRGSLFIADDGVGHRSTPIPRWHTCLRSLNLNGTDSKVLWEYQKDLESPPGIHGFAYDPHGRQFYLAAERGIVRTDMDGANPVTVLQDNDQHASFSCMTLHGEKLWFSDSYRGLIKSANLHGSGIETVLNISQGLDFKYPQFTPAHNYATGIAIDGENGLLYYSDNSSGSIRRFPLKANTLEVEIFTQGISHPTQLRVLPNSTVYWVEYGPYTGSVTALKRAYFPLDRSFPGNLMPELLVSPNTTDLLLPTICSFDVSEEDDKIWISTCVASVQTYSQILEMRLDGSGVRILNGNVTQIGVPRGLEYVV